MLDVVERWLNHATLDQLETKLKEYRDTPDNWSGRDNELKHQLIVRIKREIEKRTK